MTTLISLNSRTKAGKTLLELARLLSQKDKNIKVITEIEEKSPYNPEFVAMVKKSAASKKLYEVNTSDVWGSLGLK